MGTIFLQENTDSRLQVNTNILELTVELSRFLVFLMLADRIVVLHVDNEHHSESLLPMLKTIFLCHAVLFQIADHQIKRFSMSLALQNVSTEKENIFRFQKS